MELPTSDNKPNCLIKSDMKWGAKCGAELRSVE
jgi:hypothetical protein